MLKSNLKAADKKIKKDAAKSKRTAQRNVIKSSNQATRMEQSKKQKRQ